MTWQTRNAIVRDVACALRDDTNRRGDRMSRAIRSVAVKFGVSSRLVESIIDGEVW